MLMWSCALLLQYAPRQRAAPIVGRHAPTSDDALDLLER
jgi:hypothetical protein